MSSPMLDWVCRVLDEDDEIVVPVKRLWNEWHARHPEPSLADFTAQVLADERIDAMGAVDHAEGLHHRSADELAEVEREMEASGHYSGPRVKLKSRALTLEHIVRMITRHNDRLEQALRQARQAMPGDVSEAEEARLIEALELARRMRRSLRDAGLDAGEEEPGG